MNGISRTLAISAVTMLALGGTMTAKADPTRVSLTVPNPAITAFTMNISMLRHPNLPKFREMNNLEFELINMQIAQAPVAISRQDVAIGESSGISTVMSAWNKGAKNLVVFAVGSVSPVYQLITQPGIKNLKELQGKTIGSPGLQSASTEAIEMIMKRGANMLPSKDYDFVSVGAGSARVAALSSKTIDALASYPPDSYQLQKLGFRVLANESTYVPQYVTGVQITSREWATKNKDVLVRVIKGMIQIAQWMKDPANKSEVIEWMSKNFEVPGGGPLGEAFANDLYEFYIVQERLSFNGYAPEAAVRANLDILKERGYLSEKDIPPLGQIFDFSYLNAALRDLGLPPVAEFAR